MWILPWTNLDIMGWRIVHFFRTNIQWARPKREDKVSFTKWHFPTRWLCLFLCCPDGCSEPLVSWRASCPGRRKRWTNGWYNMVPDRMFWNWVRFFLDGQQQNSGAIILCINVHVCASIVFLICLLLCGLAVVSGVGSCLLAGRSCSKYMCNIHTWNFLSLSLSIYLF